MDREDYSSVIRELKQSIPAEMEKNTIPGLSIALVDGDDSVWAEGFGYTDLTTKHKVTRDTLFSLQSISKTCTATGFMIAADKGLVTLDDPLKKHYPGFRVNSRFGEREADKITFRHLLSHRSGLTHHASIGNAFSNMECTFEEHVESISDSWLKFPVGERYSYSNLGIDLAGYALQLVSGVPFPQFMKEELLDPIGMADSTYDQRYVRSSCVFAKGHSDEYEEPPDLIPMVPAGGLFSTARDMAKFVSFHLSRGKINGKHLLDQNLLEEMYKPQFPATGQLTGHGLGILQGLDSGIRFLHNSGNGYGYATYHMWYPEPNIGLVILTNQNNQNVHQTITYRALNKMQELKCGHVKEEKSPNPVQPTKRHVKSVETEKLRSLEGEYRVDTGLMLVRLHDGKLYRTLPSGKPEALTPHSETEFTNQRGDVFAFRLNEEGKPLGVSILGSISGPSYCPLHLSAHDTGPDKQEWRRLTGIYSAQMQGNLIYYSVTTKAGYLYMHREGTFREYRPNFFFTSEGEAVIFAHDTMSYANILLTKEKDPYGNLSKLVENNTHDKRLRKRSVQSLADAYRTIGDLDKAIEVYRLNATLHPDFKPAFQSLADAYDEKGDKVTSEKYHKRILELS